MKVKKLIGCIWIVSLSLTDVGSGLHGQRKVNLNTASSGYEYIISEKTKEFSRSEHMMQLQTVKCKLQLSMQSQKES